ncbi:MAG: hypothetical protein AAFP90_14945 [Planctomycetota bacterium]
MQQTQSAKIDFKKYRTTQLFETVSELLDYRGTMGRGFYQAVIGTFVAGLLMTALLLCLTYLFFFRDAFFIVMIFITPFGCFPGSIPAGFFYSIAYLVRRSLDNMLLVVDQLLETTKNVATDIQTVRSGQAEMPSA